MNYAQKNKIYTFVENHKNMRKKIIFYLIAHELNSLSWFSINYECTNKTCKTYKIVIPLYKIEVVVVQRTSEFLQNTQGC